MTIDENGSPVIIEYKRTSSENVINQGLFYLDWLMDHRGDFEVLVMKTLGTEAANTIDWTAPRLICIAADLVIPPFLAGCMRRIHATIFSFWAGVMPPMPMFGRSL
ncbi:hypothetical protein MXB90_17640, partial [Phaeovulum sp. NW3]|nr:hypothetical protein [Phaeovulum sp. NW3]